MKPYTSIWLCAILSAASLAQDKPPNVPRFARRQKNIALGKPYKYSAVPAYRLTRNETDLLDLTDGSLSHRRNQKIWFDPKACAWKGESTVSIQLDLGAVEPIKEVAISLLGGAEQGSLKFPKQVELLVSHDAKNWRLAGRYRKRPPGQKASYPHYVPKEEGKAWTHALRFRTLKCAARYVGLKIHGDSSFIATDEMYVFRGYFPVAQAHALPKFEGEFVVHEFAPGRITAYFDTPTVYVSTNVQTYQALLCADDRANTKPPVKLRLDLPRGITLRRYMINTRYGGAHTDDPPSQEVTVGDQTYTRYKVATRGVKIRYWGHLFLASDWPDGKRGTMRLSAAAPDAEQPWEEYAIEAVRIDPVDRPKRVHVSVCWMTENFWIKWPGALEAMRAMGLTAVPFFPRHTFRDGKLAEGVFEARQRAAEMGFDILINESPIHRVRNLLKSDAEIGCQPPSRENKWMCPSYRGPHYQEEVEAIAQRFASLKPTWLIYDCEAFSGYKPEVSQNCTRCQKAFAASGLKDWQQFASEKGNEFYRDVDARIQQLVPGAQYQRGSYGVAPSRIYHGIWDMARLHPDLHQFAMPSIYRFRPVEVRDSVREQRQLLTTNDIVPWIQPGNLGQMPAEHVRCMLLESLLNGCRGVAYYTSDGFDAAKYDAMAQGIAVIRQIEDIVMDGQPLTGAQCSAKTVLLGGMAFGGKAALLVSDYDSPDGSEASVRLPARYRGGAAELTPDGPQNVSVVAGAIRTRFGPARARVYLLTQ